MSGTSTKPTNTSREPKAPPYVDCIQWVPRRFAGGPSPVTLADLVFTQHALKAVRDHAGSQPTAATFGLLIGRVHEDPTCARPWVSVEHVLRGSTLPANHTLLQLDHAYEALLESVDDAHGVVVGWYCSHPGAGLYLSPDEARFHESRFGSPWDMALVVVGDAGRFTGGVFQRTTPEGLSRSIYTPFYELVDASSEFNGNTKRTFVGWPNYQTETRVVMAGRGSVSAHIPLADADPYADSFQASQDSEKLDAIHAADRDAELPYLANAPKQRQPVDATKKRQPDATKKRQPANAPEKRELARAPEEAEPASAQVERARRSVPAPPKRAEARSTEETATDRSKTSGAAPPRSGPPTSKPRVGGAVGSGDIEADWEKKQIQRSLMAVGRSIGPTSMGDLSTPVELGPGDESTAPPRTADTRRPGRDDDRAPESRPVTPTVIRRPPTITSAGTVSREPGHIGRARRRGGLPLGKIIAAAACVVLLAGGGWVGAQALRGPAGAVAQEEGQSPTAAAGVSLAPRNLFSEGRASDATRERAGSTSDSDPSETAGEVEELGPQLAAGNGRDDPTDTQTGEGAATPDPAEARDPSAPSTSRQTAPGQAAQLQSPPDAPNTVQVDVDDPDISAYENALRIFRTETERYDTESKAFDAGTGSCNGLNLALRGVRESYGRLERRYNAAAEKFAGPQLRAFEGAGRQNAMIATHYSLTDCPSPTG